MKPCSISSFVNVVDIIPISVLSEDISLIKKEEVGLPILFLKKLYWTTNSPEVYSLFCKSWTGSISIIGYNDPDWVFVLETIPTLV